MFFTDKWYRSINIGCINSKINNIIPLRIFSIPELSCFTRKFATRLRVTSVHSLSSPPLIDILTFVPKEVRN